MAESHKTRSHTELFLIGHPKILEDGGKLPLAKDVIQHLKYYLLSTHHKSENSKL